MAATLLFPRYQDLDDGYIVSVRIGRELGRLMDLLIQSPGIPYQTKSDLLRAAVGIYVQLLQDAGYADHPEIQSLQQASEEAAEASFRGREEARMQATLAYGRDNLLRYLKARAWSDLSRDLNRQWASIAKMAPGYWRNFWTDNFCELAIVQVVVRLLPLHGLPVPSDLLAEFVTRAPQKGTQAA